MTKNYLILPDLHVPFHDVWALDQWFWFLEQGPLDFDGIEIIGDMFDAYTISRFDKNPERKHNIQHELDQTRDVLVRIRDVYEGPIRYTEGNHEDRLRRILWGKASALAPLRDLTVPQLLGLKELNVEYHPLGQHYKLGPATVLHGNCVRKHAGSTARTISDRVGGSVLVGHSHRQGWVPYTTWDGVRDGWEVGHLTDTRLLDYVIDPAQWQQGWGVLTVFSKRDASVDFARILPTNKTGSRRALYFRGEAL